MISVLISTPINIYISVVRLIDSWRKISLSRVESEGSACKPSSVYQRVGT